MEGRRVAQLGEPDTCPCGEQASGGRRIPRPELPASGNLDGELHKLHILDPPCNSRRISNDSKRVIVRDHVNAPQRA